MVVIVKFFGHAKAPVLFLPRACFVHFTVLQNLSHPSILLKTVIMTVLYLLVFNLAIPWPFEDSEMSYTLIFCVLNSKMISILVWVHNCYFPVLPRYFRHSLVCSTQFLYKSHVQCSHIQLIVLNAASSTSYSLTKIFYFTTDVRCLPACAVGGLDMDESTGVVRGERRIHYTSYIVSHICYIINRHT